MSTTSAQGRWPRPAPSVLRRTIELDRLREFGPLVALLALSAALYLWGLSHNGFANDYYAAAVQAGTHSWKAFLFGSLDAANYITVDKTPASLWVMELSSRIFGFSSVSMLLPQALEGVAAVGLLYATMRRWFGRRAALLSGLILALTPVAAMMFRFNNPDALLVLLFVVAAYSLTRALERGTTRWLLLTGVAVGLAFLTKELQALLVVPGFAAVYLLCAPVSLRRRLWQLVAAGGALLVSAGWWVALVELWPASSRPYFGDSTSNSILQVIFGSNGLDRISSGGLGGGPGGGFSGSAGLLRLFNPEMGGQIGWLLPAAVIVLAAGLVWRRRAPRTDRTRAALLLWGSWLAVTGVVFSLMTGIIHPYYTNSLAPAIAALVGVGATVLWRHRDQQAARLVLSGILTSTAVLAYVLLDRTPDWHPWLRYVILLGGLAAAASLVASPWLGRRVPRSLAAAGVVLALAGPTAYTLSTVSSSQSGGDPLAGPAIASTGLGFGGGGFPGGGPTGGRAGGSAPGGATSRAVTTLLEQDSSRYTWVAATSSAQDGASLELATDRPVMAIGGFGGSDPAITVARFKQLVAEGKIHYYVAGRGGGFGPGAGPIGGFGPDGGGLGGFAPPSGSRSGRGFPLPPGGASGARPGTGGLFGHGDSVASQIQSWVTTHFTSKSVGGTTVYDLTQPRPASS